ncbi:MFS polyamine transporter [Cyathus striatus]|nr:MFS polyamine transporter [Cyathus striatus]
MRAEEEAVNHGFPPDVLVVDWEEGDMQNPKNWSKHKKWRIAIVVSLFTFVSPLASAMIAPASKKLGHDFGITSKSVLAMTTSIFVLGFGTSLLGPLSEIYGRAKVLQLSNLVFLAFNTGCGFAKSTTQIMVFRFLGGVAGGAPLSIGGGVLSDMFTPETRGQAVAIYSLMPMLGPVVGPIAGAWIAQKTTWRWVYWSSSLIDLPIQALGILFLRETFAPLLLSIRAKRIRSRVDPEKDGYTRVMTVYDKQDRSWQSIFKTALSRPLRFFATESIVQLFGLYMAFVYGLFPLFTLILHKKVFLVTIPHIFQETYGERVGVAGLHYIALGIGLTGTSQINSRMYDKIYAYLKNKYGTQGRPEFRLPSMVPGTFLLPIGILITGWTAECKTHWIGVDIGISLVGAGIVLNMQTIQIYVIDAFTLYSASALAAVNFLRAVFGFSFPLFSDYMYQKLGFGKGDTILAACAIVIGCPAPWVFWKYGQRIRERSRYTRGRQAQGGR